MRLTLAGTPQPAGDGTELLATLRVDGRLPAAPVLRVHLPAGAALLEGLVEEVLPLPEPGTVATRRFVVRLAGGSVRVTAEAAAEGAGARAEATFPPAQEKPAPAGAPAVVPLPAGLKVHGVPIDQAIPLTGAQDAADR